METTDLPKYLPMDYYPFSAGIIEFLNTTRVYKDARALSWRSAIALRNCTDENLHYLIKMVSEAYSVFQPSDDWSKLSKIFSLNKSGSWNYWLEMAEKSGFLSSEQTVWIIHADAKNVSDDDKVKFLISVVENRSDGASKPDQIQDELMLQRSKFILFVYSIDDYRSLRTSNIQNRTSTLRPLSPMTYLDDMQKSNSD